MSDILRLLLEDRRRHEEELAADRAQRKEETQRRDDELAAERMCREEEAQQHAARMNEQMDILRSLVDTSRTPGAPGVDGRTIEGHGPVRDKLVLTKLTDAEDIEAFLTKFERLMTVYGVAEDCWAIKLAPQLTGRALESYAALSSTAASEYKEVKKAILCRYDISEETYRQRFRSTRRKDGESYTELSTRLKSLATKWLAGCDSVATVIEKLVVEHHRTCVFGCVKGSLLTEMKQQLSQMTTVWLEDGGAEMHARTVPTKGHAGVFDVIKRAITHRNARRRTPATSPLRPTQKRNHRKNQRASLTLPSATTASREDISQETAPKHSTVKETFTRVVGTGKRWFWVRLVGVGMGREVEWVW